MGVNFILNFMRNPNINFILLSEVIRIKPILKLNEILNQALLKDKIEEIGIQSRALPTILLYLFGIGKNRRPGKTHASKAAVKN